MSKQFELKNNTIDISMKLTNWVIGCKIYVKIVSEEDTYICYRYCVSPDNKVEYLKSISDYWERSNE